MFGLLERIIGESKGVLVRMRESVAAALPSRAHSPRGPACFSPVGLKVIDYRRVAGTSVLLTPQ